MREQILSLWKNKSKAGKVYYSGYLKINGQDVKIVAFPNYDKQEGDSKPSMVGYLSEELNNQPQPRQEPPPRQTASRPAYDDEEIPF